MKFNNQPSLRFQEFLSVWSINKIRELGDIRSGSTPYRGNADYFVNGSIPWVKTTDLNNSDIIDTEEKVTELALSETSLRVYPEETVLVAMYGGFNQIGRTGYLRIEAATNQALSVINVDEEKICPRYLLIWLNAKVHLWKRFAASSRKDPNITGSDVGAFPVAFSSLEEQQKIADFISAVDKKISLLKQKHSLLQQYKKGVMQQLFSQQIRFKDDNGKDFPVWQEKKFNDFFERVTRKNKENNLNVLTISAQRGLINQEKYFNKSVSAQDVTGYYLIEKGEFAYNKSYSKGYPMGAIKRLNDYGKGVVSTLYICFKSTGGDERFWEQYFEAGLLNREIHKIAQEGARNHGLLNVSVVEFFRDIKVTAPDYDEQAKIADFLSVLDKKINMAAKQIELTQTFKKGLLQQMFV